MQIPRGVPLLLPHLRWAKRLERVALEVTGLFNRAARREQLEKFEAKWSIRQSESLAFRLAFVDLEKCRGPTTALRAANLRFLPSDMSRRAGIYQLHAEFEATVEVYRVKLGLPPHNQPEGPDPS